MIIFVLLNFLFWDGYLLDNSGWIEVLFLVQSIVNFLGCVFCICVNWFLKVICNISDFRLNILSLWLRLWILLLISKRSVHISFHILVNFNLVCDSSFIFTVKRVLVDFVPFNCFVFRQNIIIRISTGYCLGTFLLIYDWLAWLLFGDCCSYFHFFSMVCNYSLDEVLGWIRLAGVRSVVGLGVDLGDKSGSGLRLISMEIPYGSSWAWTALLNLCRSLFLQPLFKNGFLHH